MPLIPFTKRIQTKNKETKHKTSMCWVYLANVSDPFQLGGLSIACSPISAQYHKHIKLEKKK